MTNDVLKIKVLLKTHERLLANANISIATLDYGFVTIKGCQIWKSNVFNERLQESINITPPTRMAYGKYHSLIFFEDNDKWFKLEREIYDEYCREKSISGGDIEEVNLNDIPL